MANVYKLWIINFSCSAKLFSSLESTTAYENCILNHPENYLFITFPGIFQFQLNYFLI